MLNTVILQGRLVADPVVRESKTGGKFVTFTIANSSGRKDQTGMPIADFFDCTAGGKTADMIASYWHKGKEIILEGSLRQDRWTDSESGANRSAIKISVYRVNFCGSKDSGNQNESSAPQANNGENGNDDLDGFMNIPDGVQDELPFV